jgi:LacI family transcriptional regulator
VTQLTDDAGRVKNPTLRDVAKLAGVSVATASKALNDRAHVHPSTRLRVQEAARLVSFTPNALARGLLSGATGTVGLITGDLDGRFSIPIMMGAEDAFGAGKTSVFLCDARDDAIREQYHLRALLGRRVDGLIVVGSSTNPRPSLGSDLPVPVVYAYAPSQNPSDISLVPDDEQAGLAAVQHLLKRGRSHVAHITGGAHYSAAQDRARGVGRGLADAGLALVGGEARFGTWSEEWGRSAAARLVHEHPETDALLCGSDQIARGALDALRELGWDVPGRIAVMGFDNWELFSAASRPPLTTVDMNLEALGRAAAKRLFAAIDGDRLGGVRRYECRVVVREST